jgi:mutator protein MutT
VTNATICEITKNRKILLQKKSTGRFGEGKWNGPGGKLDPRESPREGVIREVKEETGLTVLDPLLKGEIDFYFGNKPKPDWTTYIFLVTKFTGEMKPNEEGELKWFSIEEIPYRQMWPDDVYWLPEIMDGKKVKGTFWFDAVGENVLKYELEIE